MVREKCQIPASKATPAIDNCKGRVQRKVLVDQVHVSGALSGACTGKGPQIANPRPTPKPGNLGPPWPLPAPGQPCRLFPRPPPRGPKIIVGSFGIPWG